MNGLLKYIDDFNASVTNRRDLCRSLHRQGEIFKILNAKNEETAEQSGYDAETFGNAFKFIQVLGNEINFEKT